MEVRVDKRVSSPAGERAVTLRVAIGVVRRRDVAGDGDRQDESAK
jgi:hypothetical protein